MFILCAVAPAQAANPIRVVTSVAVMSDIISIIGGELVTVHNLVSGSQCSLNYEPRQKDMIMVMWADLWIGVGAGLDRWIDQIIKATDNRQIRLIDASKGTILLENVEPHIWFDPAITLRMAENIALALTESRPEGADHFRKNLSAFAQDIRELQDMYQARFDLLRDRRVISYAGTYTYLFHAFGLQEVGVIQEVHGQEASPRAVAEAMDVIAKGEIKAIVGDAEVPRYAEMIAKDLGITPILLRSGEGNLNEVENYLGLMEYNLSRIAQALLD